LQYKWGREIGKWEMDGKVALEETGSDKHYPDFGHSYDISAGDKDCELKGQLILL
jgi:hypothetical protein